MYAEYDVQCARAVVYLCADAVSVDGIKRSSKPVHRCVGPADEPFPYLHSTHSVQGSNDVGDKDDTYDWLRSS